MGEQPGNWEELTLLTVGADLDLQKILEYKGASLHFQEMFVPTTHNTAGYGNLAGGDIIGQPGPYIPLFPHLIRFTWEQKAFNNRLDLEAGKANAGTWIVLPVCLVPFACQSPLTQYDGGAGEDPTPYANWLARAAYNFTPALTVQASEYRSTANFPWTNGWELDKTLIHGVRGDSNVYVADLAYRTTYQTEKYPKYYEFSFYHNTAEQKDEFSTGSGYSNPTADIHHGTNGMYAAARQTIYRLDGGNPGPSPDALSLYGALNQSFDMANVSGLETDLKAGIISDGLFKRHRHDSFSLKFTWMRITNDEQLYLQSENLATGGTGYHTPRSEFGLGPEAAIVRKRFILMPFAQRVWNPDTVMNPLYAGKVEAGWGVGGMLIFRLDSVLGLTRH
jgi:porin